MNKLDTLYMDLAKRTAKEGYCRRAKVGSMILTANGLLSPGLNGTISGFPNVCEIDDKTNEDIVIHSEANSLYKLMKEGVSTKGSTIYVTLSPCVQCCKMIISAGVQRVVYAEEYRDTKGLDILKQSGIIVEHLQNEN